MMTPIVIAVVVFGVAVLGISVYNRLIALKGQTDNSFKQIDVQLKRRHDLIPNLVEAAKGAMKFERETLEAVVSARNAAVTATANASPGALSSMAAAEGALSAALSRFSAVVEAYPDLKATGNIGALQEELASTENKVAFARQAYNDTATLYNVAQRQFPAVLFAGIAGAAPAQLWQIEDTAERVAPKISF